MLRACLLAAAALALAACGDGAPDPPPERREPGVRNANPDVFLIVVDTLRADRTSAYGYDRPTTPWLAARAAGGALFEDASVQGSWTLPSMVSLMTGRYMTRFRDRVPEDALTLGERFRSAGYRTVAVVGNILVNRANGFARGYQHFDAEPAAGSDAEGARLDARALPELIADALPPIEQAFSTDDQGRRPPVFVWLHPFDPHASYRDHPDLAGALPGPPPADRDALAWQLEEYARRTGVDPSEVRDDVDAILAQRNRYDREVRFTDDLLRDLFERLKARGHLDHAVVAFTSDHGEGLWDHFRRRHGPEEPVEPLREALYQEHGAHLYAEAVRVPLVLWGAGVPAGVRVADAVELVDLAPTLLDLAGFPVDPDLHGRNLVPALAAGGLEPAREFVFSRSLHQESVRDVARGLKLVRETKVGESFYDAGRLLLDLDADPREHRDVLGERPEEVERLGAVLDAWAERHPTRTTFGEDATPEQRAMLEALGYTEEVTGRR